MSCHIAQPLVVITKLQNKYIDTTPRHLKNIWIYVKGYLFSYLRLATDVQVVSSICYASFNHWFTIKSVLKGQGQQRDND